MNALLKEIQLHSDYLDHEPVSTIYLGGGTPSLLPESHLQRIMDALRQHYSILPDAEISFEANPDDLDAQRLHCWKRHGVNRLSIGVQSFFDEDLLWMNRAHAAGQALDCIKTAQDAGLSNISIDLIYGTPTLPDAHWLHNLETAVQSGIPHLSCYALTVEAGTALDAMTRKNKVPAVSTDDQARQFLIMTRFLEERGYEHYEVSNFSLPGQRSRHNSSYWSGENYLGLGPSAHSFNGGSRQWNVANNALYIQALSRNELPFEVETLTMNQQFNEYIMTSIRTMEGSDLAFVERRFGSMFRESLTDQLAGLRSKGWAESTENRIVLTREGRLFADGIASGLFVV